MRSPDAYKIEFYRGDAVFLCCYFVVLLIFISSAVACSWGKDMRGIDVFLAILHFLSGGFFVIMTIAGFIERFFQDSCKNILKMLEDNKQRNERIIL